MKLLTIILAVCFLTTAYLFDNIITLILGALVVGVASFRKAKA